jgi:hypothetical protein
MNNLTLSADPRMTGKVVRPWFEELKQRVPVK